MLVKITPFFLFFRYQHPGEGYELLINMLTY